MIYKWIISIKFGLFIDLISETLSANPILDPQTWYTLKLSLIVGYYRKGCCFTWRLISAESLSPTTASKSSKTGRSASGLKTATLISGKQSLCRHLILSIASCNMCFQKASLKSAIIAEYLRCDFFFLKINIIRVCV